MIERLIPKAKALLVEQNDSLMFDDNAYTTKIETVKHILQWCTNEDIKPGKWLVEGKKYRFTRAGIDKIRDAYLLCMQEDIYADFSEDNHQSASAKSVDEKLGKIKPTHHLILAALTRNLTFEDFQQEFYPSAQVNIELDINAVDYADYDTLIMIENRDSFNDWYLFQQQISIDLGKVLAIYRGDSHYSVAATALLKQWRDSRPGSKIVYFGDFDLAGLRLAVSGKCTDLLLPEQFYLEKHSISQHYPAEQEKLLSGIAKDCPTGWRLLLKLMSDKRAGLRQQLMYQTPLVLWPGNTK
ncbi:MAG: hypothetical protein ACI88A_000700 [Paraglaciecola sp.]|jgi:hypothetical protein